MKATCTLYKTDFTDEELVEYLNNLSKITSRTTRFTTIDEEDDWADKRTILFFTIDCFTKKCILLEKLYSVHPSGSQCSTIQTAVSFIGVVNIPISILLEATHLPFIDKVAPCP